MKRRYLTGLERRAMLELQNGRCANPSCGAIIAVNTSIAEHWTPVKMGNEGKPDALLCFACAGEKTKRDLKAMAKVKRIRGETSSQWAKTKRGRPLKSRGFDKTRSKKMDGTVVKRETK